MRVLVTGAGGFLGRRLVRRLADAHEVVALARRPLDGVETVVGDLTDPTLPLPDRLDAVVHLAQSRRYREWPAGAPDMFAVNVAATFRLLEHARASGASHFVLASTGAVYAPSAKPLREDGPLRAEGFYPRSKLAAETVAAGYGQDLVVAVLRPFTIYGPGQAGMLVANLARRVIAGEPLTIAGEPGLVINPIHVDDAASAFAAALTLDESGAFNVAGAESVSVTALVERLAAAAGARPSVEHTAGESATLVADIARMRDRLGVTPRVDLRTGLAEVISEAAGRAP